MYWDETACGIELGTHTAPHQKKNLQSMQTDTTAATSWRRNYSRALLKLFTLTCRRCLPRTMTVERSIESGSDETFQHETKARGSGRVKRKFFERKLWVYTIWYRGKGTQAGLFLKEMRGVLTACCHAG